MNTENLDEIKAHWKKYETLCKRLKDDNINTLLDTMGDRILMSTHSRISSEKFCGPGTLIEFSVQLAILMRSLNETLGFGIDSAKILKVALLHDIGRVGDLDEDYFLPQDSDWHREKLGQMYKINENIQRMPVAQRTLFILQHFGISLDLDEWVAVQVSGGFQYDENKFYLGHEPKLAILLRTAKRALELNT